MRYISLIGLLAILGCYAELPTDSSAPSTFDSEVIPDDEEHVEPPPDDGQDDDDPGEEDPGEDPAGPNEYRLALYNTTGFGWDGNSLDIYGAQDDHLANFSLSVTLTMDEFYVSSECIRVVFDGSGILNHYFKFEIYDASDPSADPADTYLGGAMAGGWWPEDVPEFTDCETDEPEEEQPEPQPEPIDPALTDVIIQIGVPDGVIDTVLKPSGAWGVPEGVSGSESNPIVYEEADTVGLRLGSYANAHNGPPGSPGQNIFQTVTLGPNQASLPGGPYPLGDLNFWVFGGNGPTPSLIASHFGTPCESPLYFPVGVPQRGVALSVEFGAPGKEQILTNWNHAYSEFWFIRNGSCE